MKALITVFLIILWFLIISKTRLFFRVDYWNIGYTEQSLFIVKPLNIKLNMMNELSGSN